MPISHYPELAFQLQLSLFEPFEIFQDREGKQNARRGDLLLHSENLEQELKGFKGQYNLDNLELLYVYGLGLGLHLKTLEEWLKESPSRTLVILEDDLGVIDAFSKTSSSILTSPQVHLKFIPQMDMLDECARSFPHAHLQVVCSYAKKKSARFKKIKLTLQRKTVLWNALLSEELFAPAFHRNILENMALLPKTFYVNKWRDAFKGVPAIICGAGPSLAKSQDVLKNAQDKALVFAAGSAISAFGHLCIEPHFAVAVDPNPQEYEHLKSLKCQEVPLIFSSRLFHKVPELFSGPLGYLSSRTGGSLEEFLEEKLGLIEDPIGPDLGQEALSVTTLATSLAYALGCNPIIFVGVDLAYTGMQMYAPGVVQKSSVTLKKLKEEKRVTDQLIFRKNKEGTRVATLVKWVMESETLSNYAKNHPDRLFFDASQGGLGFKHIPAKDLGSILDQYPSQRNLQEEIVKIIHQTKQVVSQSDIGSLFSSLQKSLERCQTLVEQILQEALESGKRVVLQMDLEEEIAYQSLLAGPLFAFALTKNIEKEKWTYLERCIQQELKNLADIERAYSSASLS